MRRIIYLLVVFLISVNGFSQVVTKKQQSMLNEANEFFEMTDYYNAYDRYVKLHKFVRENAEMNFRLGYCVYQLKGDPNEAILYFEQAAGGEYTEAYFYLGKLYHQLKNFNMAIRNYQYYKEHDNGNEISFDEVDRHIDISNRAAQLIHSPIGVEIVNIGDGVNTDYSDYVPVVSQNDSLMLFTSRREGSTGGEKDPYNNYFEDIYYSLKENGKWQPAQNAGGAINSSTHDACVGLSHDGQTLIMFRTSEDLLGGDLYFSKFDYGQWQKPIKLDDHINSEFSEASACLNRDGNVMYFSSNRPGGFGGKDIYRTMLFGNGDWSLPTNLGPTINTSYDDDAPFISNDDSTLYFSSNGHKTIGGFDIFKSKKNHEAGLWSLPQNLGYPLNTVEDDIYFVMTGDERTGYYSSGKEDGYGKQDIYQVDMLDKTNVIVIIKGTVMMDKGGENVPAKVRITVLDEERNEVQGVYKSNSKTGKYLMTINPKKNYKLLVSEKGYQTIDEPLYYDVDDNFMEFSKDIVLTKSME